MKKIGVLTYIKEYANLGTNMQSYCTLKSIQNAFPDVEVELINYSGWKPAKRPYLTDISVKSVINDFIRIKKYNAFFDRELTLSKEKLISSDLARSIEFIKKQNYDAIYVGSDTLLELKRACNDNLTAYWLDNTINCKKFLIAASSHNVCYENLTKNQIIKVMEALDGYSLLGVRDEPTFRLLSHFVPTGDKRLQIIPDPTFTYEVNYDYVDRYIKKRKVNFNKPTVCLHLLRDTKWALQLADYFRKEGFTVASLRPAYYADIILTDLSPFEQVGIYKYFDLVITHRFHDAIFCFKNITPVIFFPENTTDVTLYHESKALTLFKSFRLEQSNYIENKENITAKYLIDIYRDAMSKFKGNEEYIKTTLVQHKDRYESFVKESREICRNQM